MKPKFEMKTATPEQLDRMEALAEEWMDQTEPMVAIGAALAVLMNTIEKHVPEEYHVAVIETLYVMLRRLVDEP